VGRQFSYYCLPSDLAQIEHEVFSPAGGRLFVAEKIGGGHELRGVPHFALDISRMGKESVLLLLLPPESLTTLKYRERWIDTFNSNVVEVGRCYTDGRILRDGRFWYEHRTFENGSFGVKTSAFVDWAASIFKGTKRLLTRRPVIAERSPVRKEWFGPEAWEAVSSGRLAPV
jgi:hypothetical protein